MKTGYVYRSICENEALQPGVPVIPYAVLMSSGALIIFSSLGHQIGLVLKVKSCQAM